MQDLRAEFGKIVAAHRKRRGWTQAVLAKKAGIGVDMVGRLETGRTGARFPTIERLAHSFGVQPAELFTINIPKSKLARPKLTAVMTRLAGLSDNDLDWLAEVLKPLLKHR